MWEIIAWIYLRTLDTINKQKKTKKQFPKDSKQERPKIATESQEKPKARLVFVYNISFRTFSKECPSLMCLLQASYSLSHALP